jgi:hypothetical protein
MSDPSLAQTLHMLNSEPISSKLSNGQGRVAKLIAAQKTHDEIVDELFLVTLCRPPSPEERAQAALPEGTTTPQIHYEDLLWALINSKHFLFNH